MLVTHPRLASAYAVGLFGMGMTYTAFNEYRHNNMRVHEKDVMESNKETMLITHTHEKYMMEAKHTHEKYMLHNSCWYQLKRIFS